MPLRPGDTITVTQNSSGKLILRLQEVPNEEFVFGPTTGIELGGWYIQLWVKRSTNDPDSAAIVGNNDNQPLRTFEHFDGSGLYVFEEFGWDLTPRQTMYAPGIYPGEILFWTSSTDGPPSGPEKYAMGYPPDIRIPISWEILQGVDLAPPGT